MIIQIKHDIAEEYDYIQCIGQLGFKYIGKKYIHFLEMGEHCLGYFYLCNMDMALS